MKKPKIALSMIVKNDSEAGNLRRCLRSIAPYVDGIFITTTALPNKEIKKICKEVNAHHSFFKWRKDFSAARNFNINQIPKKEYSWFFWCDADDYILGGENLHNLAQIGEERGIEAFFFNYVYALDEVGIQHFLKTGKVLPDHILIEHLRERLLRNNGVYKWIAPIHETLIEQRPTKKVDDPSVQVVHLNSPERMKEAIFRNVDILETQLKSQGKRRDPRTVYYLGKAYFDLRGEDEKYLIKAFDLFKEYLKTSGWNEERAQAWEYMAEIYNIYKKFDKAEKCLLSALSETPVFTTTYVALASLYMRQGKWDQALHWLKLSVYVPMPKTTLVVNPRDIITHSYEVAFNCFLHKKEWDKAYQAMQQLAKYFPNEPSVQERLQWITNIVKERDALKYFIKLADYLRQTGENDKLLPLLSATPKNIENNQLVSNLRNEVLPPKVWKKNEIAIFCGPGFECWDPTSIKKGIGGSEEAVIYLSQALTKLGWKVTVFGDPIKEGVYDGVKYLHYFKCNFLKDKFNIFIVWRAIGNVDPVRRARAIFVDMHDVPNPLEFTKERVKKVKKIFVKSRYHRNFLPDIPDEKFAIVPNGIVI